MCGGCVVSSGRKSSAGLVTTWSCYAFVNLVDKLGAAETTDGCFCRCVRHSVHESRSLGTTVHTRQGTVTKSVKRSMKLV
eukprot:3073380-Prymnesium_polylepis.1